MTLDWPTHLGERTPPADRERTHKFGRSLTVATAASKLETAMARLDPDHWRVDTGSGGPHTKSNGVPKHSANPDDPGVVVRWSADGVDYAVGCDAYRRLKHNLREATLWVEETRKRSDRPVVTGSDDFAAAELPPPDGEPEGVVVAYPGGPEPHEVLEVAPDASEAAIRGAFEAKVRSAHPDQNGATEPEHSVSELKDARDALLERSS